VTMPAEIKAALTPDEWEDLGPLEARAYFQATSDLPPRLREIALNFDQFRAMAVGNAALASDDPRKITRADVELFDSLTDVDWEQMSREDGDNLRARCNSLAAKLAALLPPLP
jgi:hypothetical protein